MRKDARVATTAVAEPAGQLEARAAAADEAAAELERRAFTGDQGILLADVDQHRDDARRLRWLARSARAREQASAGQQRLAALRDLRADILAAADGTAGGEIAAALAVIRDAAGRVRELAATHDRAVAGLRGRALALGVASDTPPSGPRDTDGGVAAVRGGIRAGTTTLGLLGDLARQITAAAAGRELPLPAVATVTPEPSPPPFAVLGRGGMITGVPHIGEGLQSQIDAGHAILHTDAEAAAGWRGRLDAEAIDFAGRGRDQVAAAEAAEARRLAGLASRHAEQRERAERAARDRVMASRGA